MTEGDVPLGLAQRVRASDLERLAQVHGWRRLPDGLQGVGILRRDDDATAEILVPEDRTFLDYADRMAEAVRRLAESITRPPREVLSELIMPAGDLLRFRVNNPSTAVGFLAFPEAMELLQSCKQSLMAAACTVLKPQKYFARLWTAETDEFMDSCKLGTERGSFVATVLCPLYGSSVMKGQLPIPASGREIEETFSRKVVTTVIRSTVAIVDAIENDRIDTLIEQKGFPVTVSANICEALAHTQGVVTENCPLVIEAQLSPLIPFASSLPRRMELRREHFSALRSIASSLRPPLKPKESHFVGHVISLTGQPGVDDLVGGDIILAFQDDAARLTKARITLAPAEYRVAGIAHLEGHYVSVHGLLEQGPRVGRIESPTDFKDISVKST